MSRVFFFVLDSFGIGEAPDAADFGDTGANTLRTVTQSEKFDCPNLTRLGLFNIEGTVGRPAAEKPVGSFARMQESSKGKDTVTGHWELAGIVSPKAMPSFPDGFPESFIRDFEKATGRKCIVNRPYSGTDIIRDYGEQQHREGSLIVYTSADSVFQIAANEADIPLEELYRYCEIAREMLSGDMAVGRVIARPYVGDSPENYKRTYNRRDYALLPPAPTMLNRLQEAGKKVIGIGKIGDIFNMSGIDESIHTDGNEDGMNRALECLDREFDGLCFINLVDYDMLYGHRRNIDGYAQALTEFDRYLDRFLPAMKPDDMLVISADHGCDPAFLKHTDHTREYVELLMYGQKVPAGKDYGTVQGFTFAADRVLEFLGV